MVTQMIGGLGARWVVREGLRRALRPFRPMDDFDWRHYHEHYRAEFEAGTKEHTVDLAGARLVDGRIVLPPGAKPLHPNHACLWEALARLPGVGSVAEVGVGGGYLLAGVGHLLPGVRLSGYDVSAEQLRVFAEWLPAVHARVAPAVHDITDGPLPEAADAVFAHTVLMHIQRPGAYRRGLVNLIASARKHAVIVDNWTRHDYAADVPAAAAGAGVYVYDSGAQIALVVSRSPLAVPFRPLAANPAILVKYG